MTSPYQADLGTSFLIKLNMVTQWNQNGPYNIYCPLGDYFCTLCPGGGLPISRTWIGCVATAGAQVMKYWTWPHSGADSTSYDWDGDDSCDDDTHHGIGATNLGADLTDPFDWTNMINAYEWDPVDLRYEDENGNPVTQTQINAVAELSYETAVALEMDFGVCGSGIPTSNLEDVLEDYFYYDGDATYSDMEDAVVIAEIQFGRPVVICGESNSGGRHAFIIYGFNAGVSPIQYLMNIGHGAGTHNVWHTKGSVKWYIDQAIVSSIAPQHMVRFVGPGGLPVPKYDGSPYNAYPNFVTALADENLPDNAIIVFKADTEQNFDSYPKLINKPLTLRGHNVTIR